jgi:hypothetical protein
MRLEIGKSCEENAADETKAFIAVKGERKTRLAY